MSAFEELVQEILYSPGLLEEQDKRGEERGEPGSVRGILQHA